MPVCNVVTLLRRPGQSTAVTAVWASILVLILLLAYHSRRRRTQYPLPPGPPGKFIVGNLGQLSVEHPELDYIRWGKEYNTDVVHIRVLGQHMVSLNSHAAATELLDRRGANYCDRPRFTLFEVMGWGLTLTFLPSGPLFKIHRRMFHNAFTQTNVKTFRPVQLHESRKAIRSLLEDPDDWREVTLLMTTSIIFRIAYGEEVTDQDSPYCTMAKEANDATTGGGIAGATLVDIFPLARYLPDWLNPSKPLRHAKKSRPAIQTIQTVPWNANLKNMEAGIAAPSFMKMHFDRLKECERTGQPAEMTLPDLQGATSAVFIAGGNSTWGTIWCCLLFLTKYPSVQHKAQREIDRVLGVSFPVKRGRLPTFEDRPALKYLDHFVMETMRCLPLNPLIIPHKSLQDDVYEDMFIPAGTTVFANATAMATNPETYCNPRAFDPDRYDRGEPYPHGNFGFGRRKCPGNWLALASVYIFLATFLATFEVEKVVDEEGRVVEPEAAVSVGLGGHPEDFQCKLRVRSPEMARLLMAEP